MEKNKKKTLTISGGVGKKISLPQTGKKPEKKAFNVRVIFLKNQGKVLQNHKKNRKEKIFLENMQNNRQQKDLSTQIQKTLLNLNLNLKQQKEIKI